MARTIGSSDVTTNFRGLRVALAHGRFGTHEDDLRGVRAALAESMAPADNHIRNVPEPHFTPSLIVGDHCTSAYCDAKQAQLALAAELWRTRHSIAALEGAAKTLHQPAPEVSSSMASAQDRCWALATPPESPPSVLPPEWEQDESLCDMAAAAAIAALRTPTNEALLPWPPPRACQEDEVLWHELDEPLRSEACAREADTGRRHDLAADAAVWRSWLLVMRHAPSARTVAVVAAVRKMMPPQAPAVQRLAFVAIGRGGAAAGDDASVRLEQRLCVAVRAALSRWRPDLPTPPQPRRELVAQCEALSLTAEYACRLLPLRPSCQPLLAQACDAVIDIAHAAREPDGGDVRTRVLAAQERLCEALRRAAALRQGRATRWRHRLSARLAMELSVRPELRAEQLLPPPSVDANGAMAAAADDEEAIGPGLRSLIRLHARPEVCGAARRALGDVLDYLLHLTPAEALHTDHADHEADADAADGLEGGAADAAIGAIHDEPLRRAVRGRSADVDACLEPLVGGAGLGAHADVIACVHATAGAPARLGPITWDETAVRTDDDTTRTAHHPSAAPTAGVEGGGGVQGGRDEAFSVAYAGGSGVGYVCNLELLSLMLREGYVERRVGGGCYARTLCAFLDSATMASVEAPPYMLRVLAEGAWGCVRTAQARDGARLGDDARAERRLALLGPGSLKELRADLVATFE